MNKHIETLAVFKRQTKVIYKEIFSDLAEACDDFIMAFKCIGFAIIKLIGWIIGLTLICALPIATWVRLKSNQETIKATEKAKREYMERMTCLHKKDKGK